MHTPLLSRLRAAVAAPGGCCAVQKRGRFVVFDGTSAPDLTIYINTDGATTMFHATITVTTKVPRAHPTPRAALF